MQNLNSFNSLFTTCVRLQPGILANIINNHTPDIIPQQTNRMYSHLPVAKNFQEDREGIVIRL